MSKSRYQICDPLSPLGHSEFNRALEVYYGHEVLHKNHQAKRGLKLLLNHYDSVRNKSYVVLASFDTICLAVVLNFINLKDKRIKCIIHNNLEFAFRNKIHLFFLRFLNRKMDFIFPAEYIKIQAQKLNLNGETIDYLALNFINDKTRIRKREYNNNAFIHGRTSKKSIEMNSNLFEKYRKVYCNNQKLDVDFENFTCKFFDDLDSILARCSDFYFLNLNNFRQYSILFKILQIEGCKIYLMDQHLRLYCERLKEQNQLNIEIHLIK